MVCAVLDRAWRVAGQPTAGGSWGLGLGWGRGLGVGLGWGQALLVLYLLSGSATGVDTPCSEFLSSVRSSPQLRLLSFSAGRGPCGSPYQVPADLPSLPWHPHSSTVVLVPGRRPPWVQPSWVRVMAGELLETGLSNVLAADWLAAPEQEVTEDARQVGERLAQVIQALLGRGSSPEQFHLIGFGVGAHVAGVAGRRLHGAVGRITGLDPFAPGFSEANTSFSLSYMDAQYVDAIHTNFNPNEPVAALGVSRPVGHVDFYISRGRLLPGCPPGLLRREEYLLCSHRRAYKIFTSSIRASCPFTAIPCRGFEDFYNTACTDCHVPGLKACPQLGYDISWLPVERPIPFPPLTAFLSIAARPPFCLSPYLLEFHTGGNSSLTAQLHIQLKGDKIQTTNMLVSGPKALGFQPQQVYQFLLSVEQADNFKTMTLQFSSQRLLYFQWRKKDIFIGRLLLIQLPRFKGKIYRAEDILAVENQSVEVHLKL